MGFLTFLKKLFSPRNPTPGEKRRQRTSALANMKHIGKTMGEANRLAKKSAKKKNYGGMGGPQRGRWPKPR